MVTETCTPLPQPKVELDTGDIYTPHSSIVSIVCPKSLPIGRIPDSRLGILGNGEEKIPFEIVPNLCDGSLVAMKH